jgi:hypothetical protein
MNIQYETKYQEMLKSCDNISVYEQKSKAIENAFRLIESHLREQFTYDYNIAAEPMKRDDAVINSLMNKLQLACEEFKKHSIELKKRQTQENESRVKNGRMDVSFSSRDLLELKKARTYREIELQLKFLKEFVLPLPHGTKFPWLLAVGLQTKNTKTVFASSSVSGTVNSNGSFNGTYSPGGFYEAKTDKENGTVKYLNFFKYGLPLTFFTTKALIVANHVSVDQIVLSEKTFKTDLDYSLANQNKNYEAYAIMECTPKETDPVYQSVIQAIIDSEHFGLWQAPPQNNKSNVQGQIPKKVGLIKAFKIVLSKPDYAPYNAQIKEFLKKEVSEQRKIETLENEQEKKEHDEFSEKISQAYVARITKEKKM